MNCKTKYEVLELFSGLEGWSWAWAEHGHNVTTIDLVDHGRHHGKFIQTNIMKWEPDKYYDVVLASPDCREFSQAKKWSHKDERKPEEGLALLCRTLLLINKINPKFWIIENVPGLEEFLGKPKLKVRYAKHFNSKTACLWGKFPDLGFFPEMIQYLQPHKLWSTDPRRAEIPTQLSNAIHEAICN